MLDLAWLAGAEPLMSNAYWAARGTRSASIEVGAVEELVEEGVRPNRRLGRWFERVHLAALQSAPGIEILSANTTLRAPKSMGGRTLGELDVLYRQDGRVVHREVAVKYYLAAKPGSQPSAWVGPGKRDGLQRKVERLATHQTTVAHQAREAGAWPEDLPFPDDTEVLLLGALFSPADDPRLPVGANPNADHGRWYYASDFAERFEHRPWRRLDKPWWLSPEHARGQATSPATQLAGSLDQPLFVARVSDDDVERAFVVPDGWWADLSI